MTQQAEVQKVEIELELRGGNFAAYNLHEPEFVVEGPSRTGKTFALLLRMNQNAADHAGYRGLILRKEAVNLGRTILRTLEEDVYHEWDVTAKRSLLDHVHFFGGNQNEPAAYVY